MDVVPVMPSSGRKVVGRFKWVLPRIGPATAVASCRFLYSLIVLIHISSTKGLTELCVCSGQGHLEV